MPDLLLELLSEEIPARMQGQAARDLQRLARERLHAAGLRFHDIRSFAGPRRLTLAVDGLPAAQADVTEERRGPRATAPETAIEGFLRSTGLTRDVLVERDGVLFATLHRQGRPTAGIVADMVGEIVRAFPWPKSMRSGAGTLRWVRPLRRIVCLFDGKVVPVSVPFGDGGGIEASDLTEGHRFMGADRAPFAVTGFEDYAERLSDHYVILDPAERRARIAAGCRAACEARGLEWVEDEGLLDEVTGLAEWPVPILGDMDPAFLDLPAEVIRTSMRVHQRYFAVRDPKTDNLAPHFVVVANIEPKDGGAVIAHGNARVLTARLSDARFFWTEDQRPGAFERWGKKPQGVTFHAKLGTVAERVERIAALAREIAPLVGADPRLAEAAARLCKADLASGMVSEFPELQGVMGGYYVRERARWRSDTAVLALAGELQDGNEDPLAAVEQLVGSGSPSTRSADGAPHDTAPEPMPELAAAADPLAGLTASEIQEVADAVRDHYKPLGPSDGVPTEPVTVAVALADKLDTLVGFFAIDERPTGSKDPFALRRAALGVIRLMLSSAQKLSLRQLIAEAAPSLLLSKRYDELDRLSWSYVETSLVETLTVLLSEAINDKIIKTLFAEVRPDELTFEIDNLRSWREHRRFNGKVEVGEQWRTSGVQCAEVIVRGWADRLATPLIAFFADRLKVLLRDEGKRHDLVDAVFALGDDDLVRITRRVDALSAFLATEDGASLLAGYRRAANILKAEAKKTPGEDHALNWDLGLLAEPQEQALSAALRTVQGEVDRALDAEDFEAAMRHLAHLRSPVDSFFDHVLVNASDPALRLNRLRLLSGVRDTANRIADFSLVGGG